MEKINYQKQIEKVELELEKLQFDTEINKFALRELKKDPEIAENRTDNVFKFAELFSKNTKCVEKLRKKFEGLDLGSIEMEDSPLEFELNDESIKNFWLAGL